MSNIVKWAALGALVIALVAIVSASGFVGDATNLAGLATSAVSVLNSFSEILLTGRKLVNNFVNPAALTLLLNIGIAIPITYFAVRIARAVVSFIYR